MEAAFLISMVRGCTCLQFKLLTVYTCLGTLNGGYIPDDARSHLSPVLIDSVYLYRGPEWRLHS